MARGVNCTAPKTIMNLIMLISVLCLCTKSVEVEEQASRLPAAEVEALKEIVKQLGKTEWNFSVNPCDKYANWDMANTLGCNCSYRDEFCHIVSIFLRGQDFGGVLPPSIAKLPYITQVSVSVNNLSGQIPRYLGNITTLINLNLETNLFSGTVPPELGNLVNLEIFILSANNLTGELPVAFTNLAKLREFRISSNNFTGKIPDYLENFKQLKKLEIQASGLSGPIPSSISVLSNLKELRFSDLNGGGSKFPNLSNIMGMTDLMLRSCNLYGPIPAYISEMHKLNKLDLSFNKLEGNIDSPDYEHLQRVQYLYLTSNWLTGSVPDWIKSRDRDYSLQEQDLTGVLPPSVAKLPYITQVDFTRNYLSGTIPREWASTKLELLSVSVNNLSGQIPRYLGNITTLINLNLKTNLFSGTVPPELGNLVNLEIFILSENNLTGELPVAFTNLTKLREFRISSNNFTGKIPDYLENFKLEKLEIRASGLSGPIPSTISVLSNLTELVFTDLNGGGSKFPPLRNITFMQYLELRSCNLYGPIPAYISEMEYLDELDLSFNKLEGNINTPEYENLKNVTYLYLTSNWLTGSVPEWMKGRDSSYPTDISYNNFSESSEPTTCRENLNLFESFSAQRNSSFGVCLRNFPCPEDQYSLHINCGGKRTTIEGITFEDDQDRGGKAKFVPQRPIWGTSSTGVFWNYTPSYRDYIANNVSVLRMKNSELYTSARLSPLSLTYYARCFRNGNYTVKLHFSEITIRGHRSFRSVGRRIFDIYIQEKLVWKDFEIKKEAHGVDKELIKESKAVEVKNKTLEIRFHWSGKGTYYPESGAYGALISAISIEPEFKPPHGSKSKVPFVVGASVGASVLFLIFLIFFVLWWKGCLDSKISREKALRGLDLQTGFFTFKQIKAATNNFDPINKIGEGGFGSVYKGILLDGTIIAVKQLSSKSKQGNREFVNEIGMISGLQHPNLVRLYGCCVESNQLLLVYEYMENNSLARALFVPEESPLKLDWPTRQNICIGIASGLAFLHEESALKIVHRDIKTTNILLDRDLNSKISDFGLAKLDEEENTHISTRVAGTIGYMSPEYALWGYLTDKADVYSFGVVTLEIVAGKSNMKYRPNENFVCLVDWALVLQQKGELLELVDPRLGSDVSEEEVIRMIKVALLCINAAPALRPTMSAVVSMLEGRMAVHELVTDPSTYGDELRLTALKNQFDHNSSQNPSETQSLIPSSSDAPWIGSSATTTSSDLYKINPRTSSC